MKDARVTIFRRTLEGLIESLDATARLTTWTSADGAPEPLQESASHLVTRLGTADRLASGNFKGSPADVARVNAMLGAMQRLDAAYVAYRHRLQGSPSERSDAATALHAEIDEVRADAL